MSKLKPLAEQVIVITGASSGIGRATAREAARAGAALVLAARGQAGLDSIAAEIESTGGVAVTVVCDVADEDAVARLAGAAMARFGRIDSWVNNAGVAIAAKLEEMSLADARRLFDVNFWGIVHGSRAALPHLRASRGALINMGSFVSDVASPFMGMYSASKQAIRGFTDALRVELELDKAGVSVTLIKPAPIATPVLEHQRNRLDEQATMPPPFYRAEDVARTILHAATHPSRTLFVGSAARIGSILGQAFPGTTDRILALSANRLFKTGKPRQPRPDNLYEPSRHDRAHGDTRGHIARPSLYTWARTRPGTTALLLAGAGAAATLALRRRR